jgi:hypothetical protein
MSISRGGCPSSSTRDCSQGAARAEHHTVVAACRELPQLKEAHPSLSRKMPERSSSYPRWCNRAGSTAVRGSLSRNLRSSHDSSRSTNICPAVVRRTRRRLRSNSVTDIRFSIRRCRCSQSSGPYPVASGPMFARPSVRRKGCAGGDVLLLTQPHWRSSARSYRRLCRDHAARRVLWLLRIGFWPTESPIAPSRTWNSLSPGTGSRSQPNSLPDRCRLRPTPDVYIAAFSVADELSLLFSNWRAARAARPVLADGLLRAAKVYRATRLVSACGFVRR